MIYIRSTPGQNSQPCLVGQQSTFSHINDKRARSSMSRRLEGVTQLKAETFQVWDCVKRFRFHQKPWLSTKRWRWQRPTMMSAIDLSLVVFLWGYVPLMGGKLSFSFLFSTWVFYPDLRGRERMCNRQRVSYFRRRKNKGIRHGSKQNIRSRGNSPILFFFLLTKPTKFMDVPKISQSMAFDNKIMS